MVHQVVPRNLPLRTLGKVYPIMETYCIKYSIDDKAYNTLRISCSAVTT
jgi:hypothetical protein